jgi:hypothetical protein
MKDDGNHQWINSGERNHQTHLGRRHLLGLLGTASIGLTADRATATTDDDSREVTRFDGDGSIESPSQLEQAVLTSTIAASTTDRSFTGDYGHAEVFTDATPLLGFPSNGDTYGVISTGVAEDAPGDPDEFLSTGFFSDGAGDLPVPGTGDINDASYLTVTFDVPEDATELAFTYRFASEEIPFFVGSGFQDYFAFELEYPDGSSENVAELPNGEPVTVDNAASYTSQPSDVAFNAATPPITNTVDVTAHQGEQLTANVGVADVGDTAYDSAVFLDAVGFDVDAVGDPTIDSLDLPPTAIETDDRASFSVDVTRNGTPADDIELDASVTVKRRGSTITTTNASIDRTVNDDGTVSFEGSLPRAVDVASTPEGVELTADIALTSDGAALGDPIATSTFAFQTVDTVFGVAAKPNDVTPQSLYTWSNLEAFLRDQAEYVNRYYASGYGAMGAKGFAFQWLNVEGDDVLDDDGYLELNNGYDHYDDGGNVPDNSQRFVQEALDVAATNADVDYADYDTAIATNAPYQAEPTHVFSRSFWRGTPLPRINLPVVNKTIDLGEPSALEPFDTDGGLIDGIYAPLSEDTWLHEFGHGLGPGLQIGFPDLYDIDSPFQNFGNVQGWGLMGGRDGEIIGAFNRSLGSNPFDDEGWLNESITTHIIDDVSVDLPALTQLELGDDATYIVSVWAYVSVDIGFKIPDVDTDWQLGIFLLEGRPGGNAPFTSPFGSPVPLSPDPNDRDGVALYEFGVIDLDVDTDGIKQILDDIVNRRVPDITVDDLDAVDIDYVPPSPNRADEPTLQGEGDEYYQSGAATTFELTDGLDGSEATVELSRDTAELGDTVSFVVEVLSALEDYIDSQLSGEEDPLPTLDVLAETPDGRRVGFDAETGEVINEVDGARVSGTTNRRRVTVPSTEEVDVTVSAGRLRRELSERGIEPPETIEYERRVVAEETDTLRSRDGLPFFEGRTVVTESTTVGETSERAIRTVDLDLAPDTLNTGANGEFVTAWIGFDSDVDLAAFEPARVLVSGVQAVHDDQYGFVRNPPVEERDGRTYVQVKLPREELTDALEVGDVRPQVLGRLADTLFRGRDTLAVISPGADGESGSDAGGNDGAGNGAGGKGGDNSGGRGGK